MSDDITKVEITNLAKPIDVNVVAEDGIQNGSPEVSVKLGRSSTDITSDQALWTRIRQSTNALGFNNYKHFIDDFMCGLPGRMPDKFDLKRLPFPGVDRYELLKTLTELFLMMQCETYDDLGNINAREESKRYNFDVTKNQIERLWKEYQEPVIDKVSDPESALETLPYLALIRRKLSDVPLKGREAEFADNCYGILTDKLNYPCFIELIWSYWHEEGLLVQSMNSISMRFQNKRISKGQDPMAHLEIGPLRPINNLLWGYIQDEQHRLTIPRRAYEYDHHYGLRLEGKAIPAMRTADSRSKFIEAFHNLLHTCYVFFKEDADTTIIADGFRMLNALKEVHVQLAFGAHNQYGDLPWNARMEMLIQQWLLARPEMREFLTGRVSVPYSEEWMPRVEALKKLQGWSDTPVSSFNDLAVLGEQLLLSIRFGNWSQVHDSDNASNWARYWRAEIQSYMHAYRVVTGSDIGEIPDSTMPSELLKARAGKGKQSA